MATSNKPSFEIHIPSGTDPSSGKETKVFLLCNSAFSKSTSSNSFCIADVLLAALCGAKIHTLVPFLVKGILKYS